jgi:hypothetical protein
MKSYIVIFIPANRLNEEDPSDFKEWRNIGTHANDRAAREVANILVGKGLLVNIESEIVD